MKYSTYVVLSHCAAYISKLINGDTFLFLLTPPYKNFLTDDIFVVDKPHVTEVSKEDIG